MSRLIVTVLVCVIATLAAGILDLQLPLIPGGRQQQAPDGQTIQFQLRHIVHHGAKKYPNLHRMHNVSQTDTVWAANDDVAVAARSQKLTARTQGLNMLRLANRSRAHVDTILDAGRQVDGEISLLASEWVTEPVKGPNITDKETIMTLGRAAMNAYDMQNGTGNWEDIGGGFNYTNDFGWEGDGLRGHIFADNDNSTILIGLKGTSMAVFDGVETTTNDKENDNLFFGCCCGQDFSMYTKVVCDCETSTLKCNNTCVSQALKKPNRYYTAAQELYYNVTELYPDSEVWLIGHSLGGATSSLLGMTVGRPVVTFEAPGEAMAASRLRLPVPPKFHMGVAENKNDRGVYHFGHTADPIFMGTCNSAYYGCALGGYAMESHCHSGSTCIYDTMSDKGWGSHMINHGIATVVHDVLDGYNETAECKVVKECYDCPLWSYYESNHSDPRTTTTTTSSYSQTRTETCKTPGWWGCLDETTTGTSTTTSTTTTATCHSYGWFGHCLDPSTSTETSTITTTSTAAVSSSSPRLSITSAPETRTEKPTSSTLSSTTTCKTPGYVWGCRDRQ